jgi:dCTP deaminase
MILTGKEIEQNVYNKKIHINPFINKNLNPNSYNYRLGYEILELTEHCIDPRKIQAQKKITISKTGYKLDPGRLYLGNTYEEIGSDHYVISLIGRSSIGRLGLFVQITADLGNLGTKHKWTLELKCVQPLVIYPMIKIGQVSFWDVKGEKNKMYAGKYGKYFTAHGSKIYMEL